MDWAARESAQDAKLLISHFKFWRGQNSILLHVYDIFIFEEGRAVSRSPRGRNLNFRDVFSQKNTYFHPLSKVTATGISRRDPPRHGVFAAQIFYKKGVL